MRILQIDDVFHPDAGYNENIISKYFVRKGHETTILTSELSKIPDVLVGFFGKDKIDQRDKAYTEKYGVPIKRIPIHAYISGRSIYKRKELIRAILEYDPDILYIHGNDTMVAIWCMKNRNLFRAKIVTDSHMLDMAGRNPFRKLFHFWYKKCIAPIIINNKIPVIRIQDDDYVERRLGVPLSLAPVISVGSDTILFHPDNDVRKEFRREYGIQNDAAIVLYAGKMDESKGGRFLAKTLVKRFSLTRDVVFVIVGNTTGRYGEEVERLYGISENRILRFPTQKYNDLARFYQSADIAVFPKQCSLSFYDVQACGLPVIFEDNSINISRSVNGNAIVFKKDDVDEFRKRIIGMVEMSDEEFNRMSNAAVRMVKDDFDYERITERYLEIFQKCLN